MKRWQSILIGLVISAVALFFALRQADLGAMAAAFQQARYEYIVLAAVLFFGLVVIRGVRWSVLTQGRLKAVDAIWLFSIGFLFNNILPAKLGEVARGALAGRRPSMHFSSALSSIVVERLFDMVSVVILFGVVLAGLGLPGWATQAGIVMGVLAITGLIVLAVAARMPDLALNVGSTLMALLPRIEKEHAHQFLEPFIDGLGGVSNWKTFAGGFFLSVLAWFASGFVGWVLMLAFFDQPPIIDGLLAVAAAGLGIAVPAAPSGLGPFHAAVIGVLTATDYPADAARSYAFALHGLNFATTSLMGVIGLLREGVSFKEVREAAESAQQATQANAATEAAEAPAG